ncbi:MAG: PAS domain S-box protein [Coriobacteriia bacterium]|nr:PAS domain S-box protein [Coriobacteriia bacterium]MBN2823179.1 PAS domain S-box protein [Coriobacteriia bacterium]
MPALDIRTLFFSSMVLMALNVAVMFPIWWQNRDRSTGTIFWLVNAVFQLVAVGLLGLRGVIPDIISVIVANAMVIGGMILLIIGLQYYLNRRTSQVHNHVLLVAYLSIHAYFTFVQPDLTVRNINSALAMALVAVQGAWLLLHGVEPELQRATRAPGVVMSGFVLVSLVRVPFEFVGPQSNDFLSAGLVSGLALVGWHILSVAFTLSVLLMVNQRLVLALERDIAERERAQAALELSEERFSSAFHTSPDAVNINRLSDGLFVEVNRGFTELTGYTVQDIEGRTSADIQIWNDPADRERLVAGLSADGRVNNLEAVFRRKDGTTTTALMSARLIDINGERCILSVTRDISERKSAQEAVRRSEQWHRTILQTAMDGFWLADTEGRLLEVNETYCRMTGYSESELLSMRIADLDASMDAVAVNAMIEMTRECGENRFESQHHRKDGSVFDVEINVQYRPDSGGRLVAFIQDVTARKRYQDEIMSLNQSLEMRVQERTQALMAANTELVETNIRLDEATRAKSAFLAAMSHELRTPLNSVIGFSDILVKGMTGELEPEQEKQVRMINASGKYLLELVNQVLDLSAIEIGRLKVERRSVDVEALVRSATGSVAPLVSEKDVDLSWKVSPEVGAVISDRTRLEQVLLNLLGNAIKFTDSGSIRLEVEQDGHDIVFTLTDTGCGIEEEDLGKIFDEFYQARRSDVAKSEGTGLGLTVSRRLLGMLGGTITVDSVPGEGATFAVRLPMDVG